MWILFAIISALTAGLTTVLTKHGVKNTNTDVATAVRTSVVLVLVWLFVLITGEHTQITSIPVRSLIFVLLSGLATGASWICCFKALSLGDVSRVVAIEKASVVLSVVIAIAIFPAERNLWWAKLICVAVIGVGTVLMVDFKRGESKGKVMWLVFSLLAALFSTATSILAKIDTDYVPSNLATAIRTCVFFAMSWVIVFCRKETRLVVKIPKKDMLYIVLAGVTTAVNWLSYYYAIAKGQVSIVVPIDKMSILVTVFFSLILCKEKLSKKAWFGLALMVAGTICISLFT